MEFIVILRVGGESSTDKKKVPVMKWGPMLVNAEDRWAALVQAAEKVGLESKVPMRYLWKKASIKKKDTKDTRRFRVKDPIVEELESHDVEENKD